MTKITNALLPLQQSPANAALNVDGVQVDLTPSPDVAALPPASAGFLCQAARRSQLHRL